MTESRRQLALLGSIHLPCRLALFDQTISIRAYQESAQLAVVDDRVVSGEHTRRSRAYERPRTGTWQGFLRVYHHRYNPRTDIRHSQRGGRCIVKAERESAIRPGFPSSHPEIRPKRGTRQLFGGICSHGLRPGHAIGSPPIPGQPYSMLGRRRLTSSCSSSMQDSSRVIPLPESRLISKVSADLESHEIMVQIPDYEPPSTCPIIMQGIGRP